MEYQGKLVEKFDTKQITEKFKSRNFVLEHTETNGTFVSTNQIQFQLNNDRCALIDPYNIGMEIKVAFNLRGKKWEKDGRSGYMTNLEVWKIELVNAASGQAEIPMESADPIEPEHTPDPEGSQDLPF